MIGTPVPRLYAVGDEAGLITRCIWPSRASWAPGDVLMARLREGNEPTPLAASAHLAWNGEP